MGDESKADLLLGQLAIREGMATPDQVDECLTEQEVHARNGEGREQLGAILLRRGYLTREALGVLLEGQGETLRKFAVDAGAGNEDALFGRRLVAHNLASPEQVNDALRLQARLEQRGIPLRLGEVLVGRGVLTGSQVCDVLALQDKTILSCTACSKSFNLRGYSPAGEHTCPSCGGPLTPSARGGPIGVGGSITCLRPAASGPTEGFATEVPLACGPRAAAPPLTEKVDRPGASPDPAGKPFGRYRLLKELGHGAMGVVWQAWDTQLKRIVALKGILAEALATSDALERFLREAQSAARLKHPNILPVYDVGEQEGRHYFTTEYVAGQSLDRLLASPLPVPRVLHLVKTVAEALQYAHEQGIVHRDVKPANILIDGKGQPFVADFGLAKTVRQEDVGTLTASGALMGTPAYMSPEQAAGRNREVGSASDQFSLGAMMFEMLTRKRPFECATVYETLAAIQTLEPPRPSRLVPRLHQDVETICLKALEKDPSRRYPSVGEMAADIGRYLEGETIRARPLPWAARLTRRVVKQRRLALSTTALLAGLALGGYVFVHGSAQRAYQAAYQQGMEEWATVLMAARAQLPHAELQGPCHKAVECFDRAARLAPGEATPWLMRGRCFALLGDDAEAESSWTQALARDPRCGPALFERGKMALEAYARSRLPASLRESGGKVRLAAPPAERDEDRRLKEKGREDLEQARTAGRLESPSLRYLEGALALGDGRFEAAGKALAEYVEANPWDGTALATLASASFFSLDFAAAEAHYGRALLLDPRPHLHEARAKTRHCLGQYAKAVEDYTRALGGAPESAELLCGRGLARLAAGDVEGALADFDLTVRLAPGLARAYNARGTARYARRDFPGAQADFERATELEPLCADGYGNLGNALFSQNELEDALAAFGAAIELDAASVDARSKRALTRMSLEDYPGAAEDLEAALELSKDDPELLYQLALARYTAGDVAPAREALARALQVAPDGWSRREDASRLAKKW